MTLEPNEIAGFEIADDDQLPVLHLLQGVVRYKTRSDLPRFFFSHIYLFAIELVGSRVFRNLPNDALSL